MRVGIRNCGGFRDVGIHTGRHGHRRASSCSRRKCGLGRQSHRSSIAHADGRGGSALPGGVPAPRSVDLRRSRILPERVERRTPVPAQDRSSPALARRGIGRTGILLAARFGSRIVHGSASQIGWRMLCYRFCLELWFALISAGTLVTLPALCRSAATYCGDDTSGYVLRTEQAWPTAVLRVAGTSAALSLVGILNSWRSGKSLYSLASVSEGAERDPCTQ